MDKNPPVTIVGEDDELPPVIAGTDSTDRLASTGTSQRDREASRDDSETRSTSTIGGIPFLSPIDIGAGGTTPRSGDSPKRRGRPPGSRNRGVETETQSDLVLANIEDLLLSVHFMGAKLMSVPELELSTDEAKKLTRAVKEVAKHYNVSMDPKKVAIFQLLCVAGGIYGPRAIMVYQRASKEKPQASVTPINREPPRAASVSDTPPKAPSGANGPIRFSPSQIDMTPLRDGFEE